ncbi:MAG: helix-hairpin-helix domain-containing protein [Thermoplasmata archaeon]|nr:helix-hairpin-helix domain-containing protein [Thermoplasmata archaeon]
MGTNADVANALREIGDLLDLQGERFKPEAYRRAGRSIESLTEDVRKIEGRGELESIPGVGAAIGEKIREFLRDGTIAYLQKLRELFPPGIVELMRLPGIGPKTARRFLVELKVEGAAELQAAIEAGRLQGLAGFGERKIELFRKALAARVPANRRTSMRAAWEVASAIVERLRSGAPVERVEVAGSLRRRRETIGDLDLLVTSNSPERVFDVFSALPGVKEVKLRGPTKETVIFAGDIQVDLRVVEPAAFGAAWQYFTGSKDHNVRLRSLARDRGLRLNEYGIARDEVRVAGATEEEVYRVLGLPWFPPEIRENQGEFDAATTGIPTLVEPKDLRGDLHVHLPDRPDAAAIDHLRAYAEGRGWEYLGVVVPEGPEHAHLREHIASSNPTGPGSPWLYTVCERPLNDARPAPERYDYLIARATASEPPASLEGAPVLLVTHLPLAEAGSDAPAELVARWVDFAKRSRTGLEVTPDGAQDGLDSSGVRRAIAAGVRVAIRGAGPLTPDPMELAVGLARRGWAIPSGILNCGGRGGLSVRGPSSSSRTSHAARSGPRSGSPRKSDSPP